MSEDAAASSASAEAAVYRFADFELDTRALELRREGATIDVQLKVLDLIALLVRHRERVVTKRELLSALWPDEIVAETSLTQAVKTARRVLGDDGDAQMWIRTARGRGYRFVGEVDAVTSAASARPAAAPALRPVAGEAVGIPGRDAELERLRGALAAALSGRGRVALLAGPSGMGKSTLLERLTADARAQGADVVRVSAVEGAPECWVWAQVLRDFARARDSRALREAFGDEPAPLLTLVPELAASLGAERSGRRPPPFARMEAFAGFLRRAGARRPLVIAVDELHLVDRATLEILSFAVREIDQAAVLIAVAYRDSGLDPEGPLARALDGLPGHATERIPVRALLRGDIAAVVAEALGQTPPLAFAELLTKVSGGNPQWAREICTHWSRDGALDFDAADWSGSRALARAGVPEDVRAAVGARLARLEPEARRALEVAAVAGQTFALSLVRRAAGQEAPALRAALDAGLEAGLLEPVEDRPGELRFAHPLLVELLLAELGVRRRRELHLAVGRQLEILHVGDRDTVLEAIAEHYWEAAALVDPDKLRGLLESAAEARLERGDREAAARLWERALAALELRERPDEAAEARLRARLRD